MSVRLMADVMDSELEPNKRFVALIYANFANDDGMNAFPSVGTVAKKTGFKERTVQRMVKALVSDKILAAVGKTKHGTIHYKLDKTALLSYQPPEGGDTVTPPEDQGGDSLTPPGGDTVTPLETEGVTLSAKGGDTVTPNPINHQRSINHQSFNHHPEDEEKGRLAVQPVVEEKKRQPQKKGDLLDGMLFYAQRPAGPLVSVAHFPPHIQEVLAEFVRLWNVTPPDPKTRGEKGRFAEWILEGEGLLAACGEIGLEAMRRVHEEDQMVYHPTRPGSLITWARTAAAKIRTELAKQADELTLQSKKDAEREALDAAWAKMYPDAAASHKASMERSYE